MATSKQRSGFSPKTAFFNFGIKFSTTFFTCSKQYDAKIIFQYVLPITLKLTADLKISIGKTQLGSRRASTENSL